MHYIYHIPGVKIGVSKHPHKRVRAQGYSEFEILEEVANIYDASSREKALQLKYGYKVDDCPYSKTAIMHTFITPEQRKKRDLAHSKTLRGRSQNGNSKDRRWGKVIIELTSGYKGSLTDHLLKFKLTGDLYVYNSINRNKPISSGKYKGLHFRYLSDHLV